MTGMAYMRPVLAALALTFTLGSYLALAQLRGSWNSAHPSRGCSQPNLIATGGNGYLYCFAPGN
jgi:hypothetical protein